MNDSYPGMKGLIREPPRYDTTDVWYSLRDNIIPRLKGKLGKSLLDLDYTGDYVNIYYKIPTDDPLPQPVTNEYLTVG